MWTAADPNGSPVTSYSITIRASDDTYHEEQSYCDGTENAVLTSTQCTIPLATLTASPFSLVLGDSIDFKVSATNSKGTGIESNVGTGA